MSAVKKAVKNPFRKIHPENRHKLAVFFSVLLCCFSRLICVYRIRPQGAAYLFTAYDILLFALVLIPLGTSEAVHELIQKRREIGFHRNAKRIFVSAFLHIAAYVLIVMIIWGFGAKPFSESFLLGKAGLSTLLWMMPVFAADAFILLFRGYFDGQHKRNRSVYIILFRQIVVFLLILFFSGIDSASGQQVSKLLRNEEVKYIYDASGVIKILCIASAVTLLILFGVLMNGHHERLLQRGNDNNRKHESPTGQFYSAAFPLSGAVLCFLSFHFASFLVFGRVFRSGNSVLQSYVWGMYSGIYQTVCLMPFMLIFFLLYNTYKKNTGVMSREEKGELRIRCMNLSGESMIICFFFAGFNLAMAPQIVNGLFGVDSALGRRLICFGTIPMIFCCFAINTSMQLIMIRAVKRLMIHCLIALVPAVGFMIFMPSMNISDIGIYSLIVAGSIYYLLITLMNYLHLIKYLHYNLDVLRVILAPALCALIPAAAVFLLGLLFKLFMPDILSLIICFILYLFAYFFAICRTRLVTVYSLKRIPLGPYIFKLGRKLHFLGDEE